MAWRPSRPSRPTPEAGHPGRDDARLSGIDVLRKVRANEATRDLDVILLTARARDTDVDIGFAVGASDYVIKPFSPRELLHRVNAVLARGDR